MKERMEDGVSYRGIRMYGKDGTALVNVEWGTGGSWAAGTPIPDGQQVVGI